jgi:hypothetical protein
MVTSSDDEDRPVLDRRAIETGGALFHLPGALNAYGDLSKYDLSSVPGLLEFVVDFVNQIDPPLDLTDVPQQRPVGREELRTLLLVAARGPSKPDDPNLEQPSEEFLAAVRLGLSEIVWKQTLTRTPSGAQLRHHAHILDYRGFYALVAILLMTEQHRRQVGACQYCDRSFVVEQRAQHEGRPKTRYCPGTDHGEKAHKAAAAGRQLQVRARQLLEKRGYDREASQKAVRVAIEENPNLTSAAQLADQAKAFVRSARKHK